MRVVVDCLIEAVFSTLKSAKFILDVPKIVSRWPFTHGQFTPLHASFIQCNHSFYEKTMDYKQPVKDKINDGRKHLSDEFNVKGTSDQEVPLKNKRSRVPQAYHRMFLTGAIYPSMLPSLSDALYALSENHCSRMNNVVESGGESLISPRRDGKSVSSNDDKYNNNNNDNNNIGNNSNENNNCNDSSNNNNGNIHNNDNGNNNDNNNNKNNTDNDNNNNKNYYNTDNDNSISSSSKSGGSDINSKSNACYTSDIFHSENDQHCIVTSNSSNNNDNKNNDNDNNTILNTSTLSRLDETFMFNYSTYERSLNHIKIKKEEGNNPSGTIISSQISSQSVEPVVPKIPFIFTTKQIDPIGNLPHRTENGGIENIKYTTVGLRRESDRNKENNSNRDFSTNADTINTNIHTSTNINTNTDTNINTNINSNNDTNDDNDNNFIDEKEKVSEDNKYEYNEQNDCESSLVLGADFWVNKRRIENKLYFVINTTPLFCTEKFNYYIPYCPLSVDSQGIENVNCNNMITDNVSFKNEENGICKEEILDKMDSYLPIQEIRWFDSKNSVLDLQNTYSMISSKENILKASNKENFEKSNNSNNLIKRKYDLNSNLILNKDDDKNIDKEEKNADNSIYDIRIIQNIKPPLMYLIKIPHSIVARNNDFMQNPELSGAILKPMNEYEIYAPETLEDRERERERKNS